jgi:Outer membrane protein beta-barrel domain
MKHMQTFVIAGVVTMASVVAPGVARAQAGAPSTVAPTAASDSKLWIGGNLAVSPLGSLSASIGNSSLSIDTATSFGFGGLIEYRVTPIFSVGFAPNFILGIKADGGDSSKTATGLDLPIRVSAGAEVAPQVRLYGFVSPGYATVFPPSDPNGDTASNASGFMLGFGGGAGYRVAPKIMLTGELGYQIRFLSEDGQSEHLNYLTIALGVVVAMN